jgi:DNA-binding CsgD family transcriptional regulator
LRIKSAPPAAAAEKNAPKGALMPIWLARGRVAEGQAWLDAAGAESQVSEPAVWARAIADEAVLSSWVDISGMWEPVQQALAIARDTEEPMLLTRVLTACALITMHHPDLAQPYFGEAVDLARALGDSWRLSQILNRQATGALLVGDIVAMESLAIEGRDVADAIGDRFNSRQCRMLIALAQACHGETATAASQYADLIAEANEEHDVVSAVSGLIPGAFVPASRGDVDGARTAAAAALEACRELGFLQQNRYLTVTVAELAAGDAAAALDATETALRSEGNVAVEKHNLIWPAHAALACGDTARARRWADEAVAATNGIFLCQALMVRARILISEGNSEQAATDAYEGLAIASNMAAYQFVPDLLEILAELVSEPDSPEHAARLLGAAQAMRERFELARFEVYDDGYQALVAKPRNALDDSEFHTVWGEGAALTPDEAIAYAQRGRGERKRPSSGWGSLTPTEQDVVRLVAEGIPNKDIATRLFISPRTVQSHLRHVYNKLGLTSRVQLAQEAARHSGAEITFPVVTPREERPGMLFRGTSGGPAGCHRRCRGTCCAIRDAVAGRRLSSAGSR